ATRWAATPSQAGATRRSAWTSLRYRATSPPSSARSAMDSWRRRSTCIGVHCWKGFSSRTRPSSSAGWKPGAPACSRRPRPAAAPAEVDSRPHQGPPSKRRRGRLVRRVGLSAAAALALLVGLSVAGQRGRLHPRTPPTSNAQAYDLYLRANMLVNQRQNRENDSVAITLFERIVALDPSFAAAQAGLARAYALRVTEFTPGDTAALERARVAAEKALRLDPNLAEAHQAQARPRCGHANNFFHERAIQEDRRALSLDPNMDRAHQHLGNIYLHIGM